MTRGIAQFVGCGDSTETAEYLCFVTHDSEMVFLKPAQAHMSNGTNLYLVEYLDDWYLNGMI